MDEYTLNYHDMVLTRNLMFDYIRELKDKRAVTTQPWAIKDLTKVITDYEKTYRKITDQIGA